MSPKVEDLRRQFQPPQLAGEIAANLETELVKSEVGRFSDGEISVQIFESIRGADVFVIQSLCAPVHDNIMELLIVIDALRRASARSITAVVPYYGYARQDRKSQPREPITAKLLANLITAAGGFTGSHHRLARAPPNPRIL